jgi:hypothetical protein
LEEQVISKFDRAFGGLVGGNALKTKPTTIETTEPLTGEAETFIVQTVRTESGDHIVVKFIDKTGVVRLILPPKVANLIASQRDSLTTRRRSAAGRAAMKRRMDEGFAPAFANKRARTAAKKEARNENEQPG